MQGGQVDRPVWDRIEEIDQAEADHGDLEQLQEDLEDGASQVGLRGKTEEPHLVVDH